jgi:AcrR family transcriptional regulator
MPKANDFELAADEIVAAAVDIFLEQGLDAVSMRSVAARLGVSPAPLYSRVGNKDSLVDAIADHLLADLAPPHAEGESWMDYALRWAKELRHRLRGRRGAGVPPGDVGDGGVRGDRKRRAGTVGQFDAAPSLRRQPRRRHSR